MAPEFLLLIYHFYYVLQNGVRLEQEQYRNQCGRTWKIVTNFAGLCFAFVGALGEVSNSEIDPEARKKYFPFEIL